MRKYLLLLVIFFQITVACAHPWKPAYYVIVDTDCGFDDFRALNLLFASPDFRVLAITVSDGVLNADDGYKKVKDYLCENHHDGVLVGINHFNKLAQSMPVPLQFAWGDVPQKEYHKISYREVLNKIAALTTDSLVFINMASLNTLNQYLELNPEFKNRLKTVLCSGNRGINKSYNFNLDPEASMQVNQKGVIVTALPIADNEFSYSKEIVKALSVVNTNYAGAFLKSINKSGGAYAKMIYDEWFVLYLANKSVWDKRSNYQTTIGDQLIYLLSGQSKNSSQVFNPFPFDSVWYMNDISYKTNEVIRQFGTSEWMSCVITNELHRHVGVYAIIGAKMGERAKNYFACGADELKIVSYAGSEPPVSCMNDGLQVSTGATLGHGLISIADSLQFPRASFEYLGQTITISLKPEFSKQIKTEVDQLTLINGLSSNTYWDLVRVFALNCWFSWDRNAIFDIKTN